MFKKIKDKIEEYSPEHYSLVLALPIVLLILGFLIWNVYLYNFGFTEGELLRAKFITSGFCFLIITFVLVSFLMFVRDLFLKIPKTKFFLEKYFYRIPKIFFLYFYILISIAWFFYYVLSIFPTIPPVFGGGQPQAISLVGDLKTKPILNSLGIKVAETAEYQTENLCLIHENSNGIFILRLERGLFLDKSLYQGFSTLPDLKSDINLICTKMSRTWSWDSFLYFINKTFNGKSRVSS